MADRSETTHLRVRRVRPDGIGVTFADREQVLSKSEALHLAKELRRIAKEPCPRCRGAGRTVMHSTASMSQPSTCAVQFEVCPICNGKWA